MTKDEEAKLLAEVPAEDIYEFTVRRLMDRDPNVANNVDEMLLAGVTPERILSYQNHDDPLPDHIAGAFRRALEWRLGYLRSRRNSAENS